MDFATVRASLAHDPRFAALLEYLAERVEHQATEEAAPVNQGSASEINQTDIDP